MARRLPWRVRVIRRAEAWVDVEAFTVADAEIEASKAPGVMSVFPNSAVRADEADEDERVRVREE